MVFRNLKESVAIKNPVYWESQEKVTLVMKSVSGNMWEVLIDLLEKPKTYQEIVDSNTRIVARFEYFSEYKPEKAQRMQIKKQNMNDKLQQDLALLIGFEVLEYNGDTYSLTLKGKEIAEHGKQLVPKFVEKIFSTKLVSTLTLILHIILTVVKLSFGFLFGSAGLIADGVDNGVDTGSSMLIWLGVKYKKEKLISLIIIILMYASIGLIGYESVQKFLNPEPIDMWVLNLSITLVCGILMLILSGYQYLTGQFHKNFPILCQSVDSQNHFYTSLLVSAGIVLSRIAQITGLTWLNYGDGFASVIVGILILKSAIELTIEFRKEQEDKDSAVSHYVKRSMEKLKQRIIFGWLHRELEKNPLTKEQMEQSFLEEFDKNASKVLNIFPLGFQPKGLAELEYYLDYFQKKHMITKLNNHYYLASIIGVKDIQNAKSLRRSVRALHFQQISPKIFAIISTLLMLTMIGILFRDIVNNIREFQQFTLIFCIIALPTEILLSNIGRLLRRKAFYAKRKIIYLLVATANIHNLKEMRKKTWIDEREIRDILKIFISNKIIQGKLEYNSFIPSF
ncbi:MAG: cation transporter [Candidatus Lokiarchaeota archaeon]|nr:cation transporter [Candidatus Lokiarchaeota archaeon]